MAQQGTTEIDFGAFPGASDASVVVTGITGSPTLAEAWLTPVATVDHTADEHLFETIAVRAGPVSGGQFTIYGWNTNQINEPLAQNKGPKSAGVAGGLGQTQGLQVPTIGGLGTRIYGKWTVAWVVN